MQRTLPVRREEWDADSVAMPVLLKELDKPKSVDSDEKSLLTESRLELQESLPICRGSWLLSPVTGYFASEKRLTARGHLAADGGTGGLGRRASVISSPTPCYGARWFRIPTYEIVPVLHSAHKRSTEQPEIHLKAFGKDISLSLKQTEGLLTANRLPMWTVMKNASQPDGLHYEKVTGADTDIGDIYQDTTNMASILLHRDANGKVLVNGNIGSELVIKPLPHRVLHDVVRRTTSLHRAELLPNVTRSKEKLKHTCHHVVFKKIPGSSYDEYSDFTLMEPDHLAKRYRSKRSIGNRPKREAPYVIYPEILCIVDYDGYRLHGGDNVQIKRYFVSFWNGVDLRYKLLKGPKIRISIAGIIISRGRDATPYLERNRVGRDAIDSAAALTDMGKYLFRERRLPVYDIAVAVTNVEESSLDAVSFGPTATGVVPPVLPLGPGCPEGGARRHRGSDPTNSRAHWAANYPRQCGFHLEEEVGGLRSPKATRANPTSGEGDGDGASRLPPPPFGGELPHKRRPRRPRTSGRRPWLPPRPAARGHHHTPPSANHAPNIPPNPRHMHDHSGPDRRVSFKCQGEIEELVHLPKNQIPHIDTVLTVEAFGCFAYVGGACVVNKRLEKVNSVAIIEDTGGFSGIIVAAHEVGHLLGAVHDGSPPPSYLGGPGAEKCRWEDGYIMSDLRHTEKGFKWSHCSVSSFHHFLNGDTATCLYNAPHEDEAFPRVLPGKLLSLDAQCRKDRGTSACFKDDRVCAQLFCFDAGSGYCVAYRPAAEGSPCGDGQYCLNGKCVAEHENIIPDYTQNIPTYVRRDGTYNPTVHNRPLFAQYNNTEYRYPWESTTHSTPQSKFKYSSSFANLFSSTPTSTSTPYNRPTPFAATTASKYTNTTANYLYANKYKTKVNNNDDNSSKNKYGTSTTRKYANYANSYHTVSPSSKVTSEPSYPKISPFKYKTTVSMMSFPTTTKGDPYGLQTNGREPEDDECTDVGSDCAELIDRLRTWLCHLQSVKKRCCASLKTICTV
ncbi:A disintegrin and metalloproteinase with thrombospondin motifs 16 [Dufourea novaeangliae]|uniref:A disintegrin and metalloproteinase with thrombospondin motifs 16 n=1 Tax=Dufourea novaeangliae TaxID=178035 RepID=A0A154P2V4_DUFNO|nr:A disintegrin and metalloproteinase with thrombospondin motifs 16 [Dufourea novaeangliae]